jgi:hypothetical protein
MRSPMSGLLGFLDSKEEMPIATRFTLHSVLMRASCDSCILTTKEGVWEPPRTFFTSMPT